MKCNKNWKILLPKALWSQPSGILIGVIDYKHLSVTVTAVLHQKISLKQPLRGIQGLKKYMRKIPGTELGNSTGNRKVFQLIGLLVHKDEDATPNVNILQSIFGEMLILLQKSRSHLQPECTVIKLKKSGNWSNINNFMFIAFDSSIEYQAKRSCAIKSQKVQSQSQNGKLVDNAITCLADWNLFSKHCDLELFGQTQTKKCSFFGELFKYVVMLLLWTVRSSLHMFTWLLQLIISHKIFQSWIFYAVVSWPATGCQLKKKFRHIQEYVVLSRTEHDVDREMNLLLSLVVDCALGVILIIMLQQVDFANILAPAFMQIANNTAISLEQLLHWLMGAPAGLKLNRELASFLGQFFLYHIYLWVGYLSTIAPFLAVTIKFTSLCGCLGLTVFIALASDVLSILTFHIYCFYVYAARIYCLKVHGLMAFWRLFRGKKWNVLRQRVDSSLFRVDQLFLGTLLFTILLFLLPTTAVFYSVFTLMRLVVLIPQSILAKIIVLMNQIPFYSLFLFTLKAGFMVDGITFDPLPRNQKHGWLMLKMKPMPLAKVMAANVLDDKETNDQASWRSLGCSLISGNLVYPWGGKHNRQ